MNRKSKNRRNIVILILELLVLLVLAVVLFVSNKLSKIERNEIHIEDVSINNDLSQETQEILASNQTIALFGLDNRSNGSLSRGRSDVIMLATIDSEAREVRLVSVYRDSYLDTGNGRFEKCNAAYAKGGPEQAISMLNTNLDLSITDYITVDFNAVVECVDLLGGVELEITDTEAALMLGYIQEINRITGHSSVCPPSGGKYTLDGVQACAYARIRYGGGDDYRRTERQRAVLASMIAKAQKADLLTLNRLIDQVFGDIQTSFTNAELLGLAADLFQYRLGDTSGFPYEKTTRRYKGVGDVVIPCDLASNVTALHSFLYRADDYTPSNTVQANNAILIDKTGFRQGDGY